MRTTPPTHEHQISMSYFELEHDYYYYEEQDPWLSDEINVRSVVAEFMGLTDDEVPDRMIQVALEELHLDDPDSYDLNTSMGYYGDEAWVSFARPDHIYDRLINYTVVLPDDRVDEDGILPYVRGKGVDTLNMTVVEAVQSQLRAENNGIRVPAVENATDASLVRLRFDQVVIPQMGHYNAVEARKPVPPVGSPKGTPRVWGVVISEGGRYRLVDGYHRMKSRGDHNKTGWFIVLS